MGPTSELEEAGRARPCTQEEERFAFGGGSTPSAGAPVRVGHEEDPQVGSHASVKDGHVTPAVGGNVGHLGDEAFGTQGEVHRRKNISRPEEEDILGPKGDGHFARSIIFERQAELLRADGEHRVSGIRCVSGEERSGEFVRGDFSNEGQVSSVGRRAGRAQNGKVLIEDSIVWIAIRIHVEVRKEAHRKKLGYGFPTLKRELDGEGCFRRA